MTIRIETNGSFAGLVFGVTRVETARTAGDCSYLFRDDFLIFGSGPRAVGTKLFYHGERDGAEILPLSMRQIEGIARLGTEELHVV